MPVWLRREGPKWDHCQGSYGYSRTLHPCLPGKKSLKVTLRNLNIYKCDLNINLGLWNLNANIF